MDTTELDCLLDRLEEAHDKGQPLTAEEVCADRPELLEPLRAAARKLLRFDKCFVSSDADSADEDLTRIESPGDVLLKLTTLQSSMQGQELSTASKLVVEREVDSGGLGDVYLGDDAELSRKVAIKLLRAGNQNSTSREDFNREVKIIAQLNHPGVVAIHGRGQTACGRPFYSMPYLPGGNLSKSIEAYHTLRTTVCDSDRGFRDLVNRLVSVCKTVAYAHSRGIAHRDLKPQNIMLGNYGETVIIDWGSANRVERAPELKLPGEKTVGVLDAQGSDSSNHITLGYASPEQLVGEVPAGPASDIYSLGAMLYKLLTSVTPYTNLGFASIEQLVEAVKSGQLAHPSDIRPGVPRQLAAICLKAMSLEPGDRYTTAIDMADDLEKYLADARVSVCRDSFGTRMLRVIRKNRTASLLLLALFGISSVLLTLALARQGYLAHRAQQLADERLKTSATMAALIGGLEIDRRFSLLESEAQQPPLIAALREVEAEPSNKAAWERPQALLFKLAEKLRQKEIEVDSTFITDSLGTQIARVPETDVNGKIASIGANFAYRQYFNGKSQDMDVESEEYRTHPPPPCIGKVLTNAYVSVNRGEDGQRVKTAISVAITDIDANGERRILGRLGISVGVNELGIFRMLKEVTVDAFVIESRQYEWGDRNARGLALGRRKESADAHVAVVANSLGSFSSQLTRVTPGLTSSSAEQIFSQLPIDGEAVVLYGFRDTGLGIEKQDVAVAQIRVPSDDSLNVWSVLLVEQTK